MVTTRKQKRRQQVQAANAATPNEAETEPQTVKKTDHEQDGEVVDNSFEKLRAFEEIFDKDYEIRPAKRRRSNNSSKKVITKGAEANQKTDLSWQLPNEVIFEILSFLPVFPYYPSLRLLSKYFDDKFMEAMRSGRIKTLFPLSPVKLPAWFNCSNLKVLSLNVHDKIDYNHGSLRELTILQYYYRFEHQHSNLEVLNVVVCKLDFYKWQTIEISCSEGNLPRLKRINIFCYNIDFQPPTMSSRPEVEITFHLYAPVYIKKQPSIKKKQKKEEVQDNNSEQTHCNQASSSSSAAAPATTTTSEEEADAHDNNDHQANEKKPKEPKDVLSTPHAIASLQKLADAGIFYGISKITMNRRRRYHHAIEAVVGSLFDLVFVIAPPNGYLECFNFLHTTVGLPTANISTETWLKLMKNKTRRVEKLLSMIIEERKQMHTSSVPDKLIDFIAELKNEYVSAPHVNYLLEVGFEPTLDNPVHLKLLKEPRLLQDLLNHGLDLTEVTEAQLKAIIEIPAPHALPLIISEQPELLTKTITAKVGYTQMRLQNSKNRQYEAVTIFNTFTAIPLYLCIYMDCNNLVLSSLIENGSPLDYIHEETGNTLLHAAILTEKIEVARLLLYHLDKQEPEAPSDQEERLVTRIINTQNQRGQSCLILACWNKNSLQLVQELLSYGANKDLQDDQGKVALYFADLLFSKLMTGTNLPRLLKPSTKVQKQEDT